MKYLSIFLALLATTLLTSCGWLTNSSNPPYTVHHDFEVHCKPRVGTARSNVDASQAYIRIDPTKKGSGQEWDEFRIEVQEKVSSQGGSSWQTLTQTPWLDYPQALSSVNILSQTSSGQWSSTPSNTEYLTDFKSRLSDPSKFKNGGGINSSFQYRLVLRGRWAVTTNNWVTSVSTTDQVIGVNMLHACTHPKQDDKGPLEP